MPLSQQITGHGRAKILASPTYFRFPAAEMLLQNK